MEDVIEALALLVQKGTLTIEDVGRLPHAVVREDKRSVIPDVRRRNVIITHPGLKTPLVSGTIEALTDVYAIEKASQKLPEDRYEARVSREAIYADGSVGDVEVHFYEMEKEVVTRTLIKEVKP